MPVSDGESRLVVFGNVMSYYRIGRGEHHRLGGPALVRFYEGGGGVKDWTYYDEGEIHRVEGPALEKFHHGGALIEEQWWQRGKFYREGDLPSVVRYTPTGEPREYVWHTSGGVVRANGPCIVRLGLSGEPVSFEWNSGRHMVTRDEYLRDLLSGTCDIPRRNTQALDYLAAGVSIDPVRWTLLGVPSGPGDPDRSLALALFPTP